jgi:hypothetical protein|tara:strand:+ start:883 stop:1164 length:282 start_codon:yes stop_codon:yes gene_type:complete
VARRFGDRFRLVFFEDLVADKQRFLAEILGFLEVEPMPSLEFPYPNRKTQASAKSYLPELRAFYQNDVRALAERIELPPAWMDAYSLQHTDCD